MPKRSTTLLSLLGFLFLAGSGVVPAFAAEANPQPKPAGEKPKEAAEKPKPAAPEKKEARKAEEPPAAEKEKPADSPKLHEVKPTEFVVKAKLDGVVEATRQTPIAFDLERWSDLTVVEAVPHGTRVKEGEIILRLEKDKLQKAIEKSELDLPLAELDLSTAELELENLEKTNPLDLESSRRSKMQAEEDFAYFEDVTMPMRMRDAEEDVKQIRASLSYAEEELAQLKKMYEADDLTEETEEIILQRAQNNVDQYRWMLEQTEARSDRTRTTTIPREHESLEQSLERRQIDWRSKERSAREALERKRLEVAGKRRGLDESREALEEHRADLAALEVKAPHDGIVYYGMNQRGKWTTGATVEKKLIPGGKISMNEIVMTVADPVKQRLRLAVPEDKLKGLTPGLAAEISPKWDPERKLPGKVATVSFVPESDSTFDTVVSVGGDGQETFSPGMTATAEVTIHRNEKALVVPNEAIKKEDGKSHVTLEGGKKVVVKTGLSDGKRTEILDGLEAGAKVVLPGAPAKDEAAEKPEEKKP